MKYKNFILFLFIFVLPFLSYANKEYYSRKIKWKGFQTIQTPENTILNILYFDEAIYISDFNNFPVYFERFKLNSSNVNIIAKLKKKVFKEFDNSEIKQIKNLKSINDSIYIKSSIIVQRKIPYAAVYFVPIRRNKTTNKYEKLISFEIELNIIKSPEKEYVQKHIYSNNSVLSQGDWYKIRVNKTGIYKITYSDLENMGIDPASVNPQNIKLYGNGAGMLPENNSSPRDDDLKENAIFVVGADDSKFDKNDYILFYGQEPTTWEYNKIRMAYEHKVNIYSNYTYYFITVGISPGKRISTKESSTLSPTNYVDKFDDYVYHEKDKVNLMKSGKQWYGEKFDAVKSQYDFSYYFPDIDISSEAKLRLSAAANSNLPSSFVVLSKNFKVLELSIPANTSFRVYGIPASKTKKFVLSDTIINITIKYNYNESASNYNGWLNYLELNVVRHLTFRGSEMSFRNISSVGENNISEFTLSNASKDINIWDVTNPKNVMKIDANLNNNKLIFRIKTDTLHEFIAFDGSSYYSPEFVEKVKNQNLHSTGQCDMIIVSHPDFINQANRLANLHRNQDNYKVIVVTPQQIYNEFSSGAQDVAAIRDFAKMLYDRADTGKEPKYLLLFGDASYDYKNRLNENTNFVPTYESNNSLNTKSFVTDDFFGLFDDDEGYNADGTLDIGIGRFPVKTMEEAKTSVDKIEIYTKKDHSVMGDWRNTVCFIADDQDKNMHIKQAESLAIYVDTNYKVYNIDKIYLDAYQQISTPFGDSYPDVKIALNKRVEQGALVINYTGHGGETGLTGEHVLEISDINRWTNINNMPLFVTATCSFCPFDDPEITSAGELVFLNPKGGGIALFTTSRPTISAANFMIIKRFYKKNIFEKKDGRYPRLGDIVIITKTPYGSAFKNFVLIGDPALQLAYPKYNVITTSINNISVDTSSDISVDTITALSKVTVKGVIQDDNGSKITNFNGIIYPEIFDKYTEYTTLGNDKDSYPKKFLLQNKILYKGRSSVINGAFSFSFIVPKDISCKYGFGKISYYACDDTTDANGYFENIIIGRDDNDDNNDKTDLISPHIDLYINDTNFIFGGKTNENPLLLAYVKDSSGVNAVGNGIGHNIVAVLDDNTEKSIILNDYYEADLNTYKSGVIKYQFSNLEQGLHTLKLKVWDINNNSSEAYTQFYVYKYFNLLIKNIRNYPNPFTTKTSIFFETNMYNIDLDVEIKIFTINGWLVKTINKTLVSDGFNVGPIIWDGTNDYGNNVRKGIYIYRVKIKNNEDIYAESSSKLLKYNKQYNK